MISTLSKVTINLKNCTMKTLSLLVSLTVFVLSGFFFINDFTYSTEINHIIYSSLLIILMLICIIGILINLPMIILEKRKMRQYVYSKFAQREFKNKKFHYELETS